MLGIDIETLPLAFIATLTVGATSSLCMLIKNRKSRRSHDAKDPVTGLTGTQKKNIRDSWALVRKDLRAAGLGFFHAYDFVTIKNIKTLKLPKKKIFRFFKAHPEYQKLFEFANVPVSELEKSKTFVVRPI